MASNSKKKNKEIEKLAARVLPGFLGVVIEQDGQTGKREIYSPQRYGERTPISDDIFGFCGKYPWKFAVKLTGETEAGIRDEIEFDTLDPVTFEQLNSLIVWHGEALIKGLGEDIAMKARIIVVGMGR